MPITKSAKKALRQSLKRRAENLVYKNKMKRLVKEMRKLIFESKIDEAKKLIPLIYKAIDKAAKTNVIKKNTAGRKKSRIMKLINSKSQAQTP